MKPLSATSSSVLPEIDLPAITWDCAFCGRLRVCPFAAPYPRGPKALEACRACGALFVEHDDDRKIAIQALIANHLI